ncbi:cell division topological specificity factor MinE [Oricola sp.]|uniref:cell division topological specificity factor MinE n=1 Tax=Oricola sp. TaxID=1979950 RepID=UPI000C94D530|nr:cell division topological specificity factor MinE [Ahrensia sp.]|tara:strand:- start:4949 stop:5215 length:267 start_codon:yes stop_codon:yes gene_type:complete
MNILRFFVKPKSASTARERLQVLLAHERASVGGNDLVALLRDEILAVISKHVKVDSNKVYVKLERGAQVSTLEVDVQIPFDRGQKRAA